MPSGVGNDTHQKTSESGPNAVGAGGPFLPYQGSYCLLYRFVSISVYIYLVVYTSRKLRYFCKKTKTANVAWR